LKRPLSRSLVGSPVCVCAPETLDTFFLFCHYCI
jgi:hypothetical protein